jgi:predicted RNA-binding protein YlxR (DUF448 family)
MIRIVLVDKSLTPDLSGGLVGRGAWLHPGSGCLQLSIDRKAFGRALRVAFQPDASALIKHIEQAETMLAKNE